MRAPDTLYTRSPEGGYVAYQVFGEGPLELVFITNFMTNLDVMWDEPTMAAYFERLASFSRVLAFDKRGTGVSDPVPLAALPTLERWADDIGTVLDAVGCERAALLGDTEGGVLAAMYAATHPERVTSLILVNSFARWRRAPDYPIGMPDQTTEKFILLFEQHWGAGAETLTLTAPSVAHDARFREWYPRYQRQTIPRGASATMYRWMTHVDIRAILPTIRVPTLVLHRVGARMHRVEHGRYLAEHIPGAKYVELPGVDTIPFHAGDYAQLLDEVEEFLTGARTTPVFGRQLATVLFTDVVGSTRLAAERGDAAWNALAKTHDEVVRAHLRAYRGREVDHTGDGFLATFDGPARAVTCAARVAEAVAAHGITIRAGVHTGEIETVDGKIRGVAVHIAARVMGTAELGGVRVSSTVRDLVVGSGIEFADGGTHELRGVPGSWTVYEVASAP